MTSHFIFRDAEAVKSQINAFLTKYPEISEDAEWLADTLEGETDFNRVIEKALDARQEALSMSSAIKDRIDDLSERKGRYDRQADSMKELIKSLMLSAGLDKLPLPEATLTITKPRLHVEVLDVNDLPQGYVKIERKADKKAILDSFEAGMTVPGATVVKGDFGCTIRTK